MPEEEQKEWQKLWADVEKLLQDTHARFEETPFKGALTEKERSRIHEVKVSVGAFFVLDLASKDFTPHIRVENEQGKVVAETDKQKPTYQQNRLIFKAQEEGFYKVVVTSFRGSGEGEYGLTVRRFAEKK